MSASSRRALRSSGLLPIVGALGGVMLLGAAVTRLGFAPSARGSLAVDFTSIRRTPGQAIEIGLHNITKALAFAVFCGCALISQVTIDGGRLTIAERLILSVCDAVLCLWSVGTALLAGVLLGAYGSRQVLAFLPQGPVEMLAWALLIALYIDVRRRRVGLSQVASRLAVILAMLVLASVLELWAGL